MQQGYKGVIPYYETNDTFIEWKDIVGYEGHYQVSNTGKIRSVDRYIKDRRLGKRFAKGYILKPELSKNGYLYVNLNKDGKIKHCTVHRIVAQAFIPNPYNLPCVNHKDENRGNNNADNLEWITNIGNLKYSNVWAKGVQNRRSYVGENNPFYGKQHSKEAKRKISERYKMRRKKIDKQ